MFKPKYTLTNSIVQDLTIISECKAIIDHAKILPTTEIKLRRLALIRMSQSSTAIEGNALNLHQVEALVAGKKIDAPDRDIYEVKNYLSALKYIEKIVKNNKKFNKRTFLQIHKLVTQNTLEKDKSGLFRQSPVYIVRHFFGFNKKVVYTAPSASKVPILVEDLISWLNDKETANINPIIIAGIIHQEIAAIHPFVDGNGRVARAIATLILYQKGYDFRRLFALEDYYNLNREEYYKAINTGELYKKDKDLTNWLSYFIKGFKEEINSVKFKVQQISLKNIKGDSPQMFLNDDQQKIIDFIDKIGKITTKDTVDILNIPKRTAQLKLLKLKNLKIIKQIGKGPSSAYILNHD
ncbi:MAG: Fic family protein [Candidatus Shapirobacteria bacterium]|nr:Fic family protein [Candidatus Shapirobacteria bacterium]MDD3003217.1 Fic family protein [Candidatus Shapirobacteria bacterium]MDD4383204.1 Fic family protein [Candidatus Shapirobacteria bacterium]